MKSKNATTADVITAIVAVVAGVSTTAYATVHGWKATGEVVLQAVAPVVEGAAWVIGGLLVAVLLWAILRAMWKEATRPKSKWEQKQDAKRWRQQQAFQAALKYERKQQELPRWLRD